MPQLLRVRHEVCLLPQSESWRTLLGLQPGDRQSPDDSHLLVLRFRGYIPTTFSVMSQPSGKTKKLRLRITTGLLGVASNFWGEKCPNTSQTSELLSLMIGRDLVHAEVELIAKWDIAQEVLCLTPRVLDASSHSFMPFFPKKNARQTQEHDGIRRDVILQEL